MRTRSIAILLSTLVLASCSGQGGLDTAGGDGGLVVEMPSITPVGLEKTGLPKHIFTDKPKGYPHALKIVVHKTNQCGNVGLWNNYLRAHNFEISVVEHESMDEVRGRLGVPSHMNSCHTGEVSGLFVQGYVPADDIRRAVEAAPHAAAQIRGVAMLGLDDGESGNAPDIYRVVLVDEFDELDFGQYTSTKTP